MPPPPKRAPQILAMAIPPTLSCEEDIAVEWEKDDCEDVSVCEGVVKLECMCSRHKPPPPPPPPPAPLAQPQTQPAPATLPTGVNNFTLAHPPGTNESGVKVKATITMPSGASHSMERTVNIQCDMMVAAAKAPDPGAAAIALTEPEHEAAHANTDRASAWITLNPSILKPVQFIPERDRVLLGQFKARKGDAVSVTILEPGGTSDTVVAELFARVCPVADNPRLKNWIVRIPWVLLTQKCDLPRVTLRVNLWKDCKVVYTIPLLTILVHVPQC